MATEHPEHQVKFEECQNVVQTPEWSVCFGETYFHLDRVAECILYSILYYMYSCARLKISCHTICAVVLCECMCIKAVPLQSRSVSGAWIFFQSGLDLAWTVHAVYTYTYTCISHVDMSCRHVMHARARTWLRHTTRHDVTCWVCASTALPVPARY